MVFFTKHYHSLISLSLILVLSTNCMASSTDDMQINFTHMNMVDVVDQLFDGEPKDSHSDIHVSIGKPHASHIWGGNTVPITVDGGTLSINRIAVLVEPDLRRLPAHGVISLKQIEPLVAVYDISEDAWPFLKTRIVLTHPSKVHVYVQTEKGVYHYQHDVTFYYRTAGGHEAHGYSVDTCSAFKAAVKPSNSKISKKARFITRAISYENQMQAGVYIKHPRISEDWWGSNCQRQWPVYVKQTTFFKNNKPIVRAYLGNIESDPFFVIRPKSISEKDKFKVQWHNTLGQQQTKSVTPEKASKSGSTLLMEASKYGGPTYVSHLLQLGARVNVENKYHKTPLNNAAIGGHTRVAELLVKAGADVNKFSPLFHAATNGHVETMKVLLANGAREEFRCDKIFYGAIIESCGTSILNEVQKLQNGTGYTRVVPYRFFLNAKEIINLLIKSREEH